MRRVLLISALLAPALLAGCAAEPGAPNKVSRSISVSEDGYAEANLAMEAGANLTYAWETEPVANLTFDLHTHVNGSVEVFHEETATAGEGAFQAPRNGTFSLHWAEPGTALRLVATVEGDFTLESFPVG